MKTTEKIKLISGLLGIILLLGLVFWWNLKVYEDCRQSGAGVALCLHIMSRK